MDSNLSTLKEDAAAWDQLTLQMSRTSHGWLQHNLDGFNLTLPQYVTLHHLHECGSGCSMSDLAGSSGQVPATMTGIIDRLVEHGLVERLRDPHDRRALRVVLTPSGTRVIETVNAARRDQVERLMVSLNGDERQALLQSARRSLEMMRKLAQVA